MLVEGQGGHGSMHDFTLKLLFLRYTEASVLHRELIFLYLGFTINLMGKEGNVIQEE
jgi:hypothetical protein